MWLLPAFPLLASFASRVFYDLHVVGVTVPRRGPILLVANHPNSLLDPFLVTVAAKRPVRFLAKAPLLSDPLIGWGVRGVGAIPVYRHRDDPSQVRRNEETFRDVYAALRDGAAVGIFPEGVSHDEPTLVPLKTGAARIALGAVAHTGGVFPIVPVGSVFESKEVFRSRAWVVVGEPVEWIDIASRDARDAGAVQELTKRIGESLHELTVNYDKREDRELVVTAAAVYDAELGTPDDASDDHVLRREAARVIAHFKREGDPAAEALGEDLARHARILEVVDMTPAEVNRLRDARPIASSLARRFPVAVITGVVVLAGMVLFYPPYRVSNVLARRFSKATDTLATYKLLYGAVAFIVWIAALAGAAGAAFGWQAGLVTGVLLPDLALTTLSYGEAWRAAWRDIRVVVLQRTRRGTIEELRVRQRELAVRMRSMLERYREASARAAAADPQRQLEQLS